MKKKGGMFSIGKLIFQSLGMGSKILKVGARVRATKSKIEILKMNRLLHLAFSKSGKTKCTKLKIFKFSFQRH